MNVRVSHTVNAVQDLPSSGLSTVNLTLVSTEVDAREP